MGDYQQIDHTADIALYLRGNSLEDLFCTAAEAWRQLVLSKGERRKVEKKYLQMESDSLEELLVNFVSELNFIFLSKGWIFSSISDIKIYQTAGGNRLKVRLEGESYDESRHSIDTEIKAVTFHQLEIKKTGSHYETVLVFDI